MAKTVNTNSATLLTAAEFLKRVDARTVGDLVSDSGTRVASADLGSDGNLAACLLDATGELESACLVGGRYLPSELASITGAGLAYMRRILTWLTIVKLYERRPDMEMKLPAIAEKAELALEQLTLGQRIFSFTEVMEAGVVTTRTETPQDVEARNGSVVIAQRYFGTRSNRIENPYG